MQTEKAKHRKHKTEHKTKEKEKRKNNKICTARFNGNFYLGNTRL